MFIRLLEQLPSVTVLKWFSIPRNFNVSTESRIELGKTWHAPADATRVKNFEINRYDPDSGQNPRIDTCEVDLDNLRADGLGCADHDQERDRFHAYLPPLL
jgi:succinate dehydrogenase / fumarate reductase iron-sulfur subunit